MFWLLVESLVFVLSLHDCESGRRLLGGQPLDANITKRYVVYIVRAKEEVKYYDSWLCGGAIVSPVFVVTSAACIRDINYMYVVAGTNRYLPESELYEDECFKNGRKKVIYMCTPQEYHFVENEVEKWSNIDIAVVKVESPFDFNTIQPGCMYAPGPITVNYADRVQHPGTDVNVYGWGHDNSIGWRMPHDTRNYNKPELHYASTVIIDHKQCIEGYSDYPGMKIIIKKYMICTDGMGHVAPDGSETGSPEVLEYLSHCRSLRNDPVRMSQCLEKEKQFKLDMYQPDDYDGQNRGEYAWGASNYGNDPSNSNSQANTKGNGNSNSASLNYAYGSENNKESPMVDYTRRLINNTEQNKNMTKQVRRNDPGMITGICQNDHGGPLVAWRGMTEVLVGVASVFRVSKNFRCTGPFLFTSTHCTGKFLNCAINGQRSRKNYPKYCDDPPEVSGFKKIERFRSWIGHPDGPAEGEVTDELVTTRPVKPIG